MGELELVATGAFALVRLTATLAATEPAPVLLVDDGSRVHTIRALPACGGQANGTRRLGYGVPRSLLATRSALALDAGARGRLDLRLPGPISA